MDDTFPGCNIYHVCHVCGNDFPVNWGDTDAVCEDCGIAEMEKLDEVMYELEEEEET